jgi:hypothetical protein
MADSAYDEAAWKASAGHGPLHDVDVNQVFLLHRHWIWTNLQRSRFQATLPNAPKPDDGAFLADECWASMYMWYATLWSVIEGFADREIDIRGPMRDDIDQMSVVLRRCRNAVFHVSPTNQNDKRLFEFMFIPDAAAAISRISSGFGRMFFEEHAFRRDRGDFGAA